MAAAHFLKVISRQQPSLNSFNNYNVSEAMVIVARSDQIPDMPNL